MLQFVYNSSSFCFEVHRPRSFIPCSFVLHVVTSIVTILNTNNLTMVSHPTCGLNHSLVVSPMINRPTVRFLRSQVKSEDVALEIALLTANRMHQETEETAFRATSTHFIVRERASPIMRQLNRLL